MTSSGGVTMRGHIDFKRNGIKLSGQPLIPAHTANSNTNPLGCCLPSSTSTSNFSNSAITFLPFLCILWAQETSTGRENELEITYAYPIECAYSDNLETSDNMQFQLPYEDAKRKVRVASEIMFIDIESTKSELPSEDRDMKTCDLILKYSYPFSQFNPFTEEFHQQSIFVIINPHSGKGTALEIFNDKVRPILEGAHCNITVQLTDYQGHATDLARELNIDEYDTILCASGDGIPYEVINGFYQRPDRAQAFSKINIVQSPGGSGNAMSLSCLGATSASLSALRILKGKPSQCDLMAISKSSSDEVILSFLSQTYGAIAQADIGTEWMRFIGGIRFDLGVAYEVLSGKKYPCELAFKIKCKNNDEVMEHYQNEVGKYKNNSSTYSNLKNNNRDIQGARGIYRDDSVEFDLTEQSQDKNVSCGIQLRKLTEDDFQLKYHEEFREDTSMRRLPEDWEIYDKDKTENMRIFYSGKMPYIAATTNFFPAALPADGAIDLVVFDSRSKFASTANALLSLEKGTHVWDDCVEHMKVEAFRLEPKSTTPCYISVDGERFPYETFQVEVLKGVLRTILWEGNYTVTGFLENGYSSK